MDIIATAARTPVGLTAESAAAAVRADIVRFVEYPFISPSGEPLVVAADPRIDSLVDVRERLLVMIDSWVVDTLLGREPPCGKEFSVGLIGRGHAGAIQAVELAARQCVAGSDALFFVVGADSYHHPDTFIWLEEARQFAQPNIRAGFVPGEPPPAVASPRSCRPGWASRSRPARCR